MYSTIFADVEALEAYEVWTYSQFIQWHSDEYFNRYTAWQIGSNTRETVL